MAQPLVNVGFWLEGWATRATDTVAAEALFSVETCTMKAASCPGLTLDCERWTLTHSSGWADGLVGLALALVLGLAVLVLGLALVLGLGLALVLVLGLVLALVLALVLVLGLGLAVRRASTEAEATAEAEVWDADGEPDDLEGDTSDAVGEVDVEAEADGVGVSGVLFGSLLGLVVGAGEVEEAAVDGVGVGDFDGFGV